MSRSRFCPPVALAAPLLAALLIPVAAAPFEVAPGVEAGAGATFDSFANLRGGAEPNGAVHTIGAVTFAVAVDLGARGLWRDGLLYAGVQHSRGHGISRREVGNLLDVSSIDAPELTQVGELWLSQLLLEGRVRVKLGRQDANADFCAALTAGSFLNGSFATVPNVPLTTYPDPGLGVAVFAQALPWLEVGAGAFDGAPAGGGAGFDTAFEGAGGGFQVVELRAEPGDGTRDLGAYRLGLWRHTEDVHEISGSADHWIYSQNHGLYVAADRSLWRDPGSADGRGLGAFLQYGWAPGDRNAIHHYAGAGLVWQSPSRARSLDSVGLAVASARLCRQLGWLEGRTRETVVETFYRAQLAPWLALQPDLQFVVRPGGADLANAVALGVRADLGL